MDSIRLSSDAERQVDEICAKYDPANNPDVQRYMDRVTNEDDRTFWLDFTRQELRATAEAALVFKGALTFFQDQGDLHQIAFDYVEPIFSDRVAEFAVSPGSRLPWGNPGYRRRSNISLLFDQDPDLGDGLSEAQGAIINGAIAEVFGPEGLLVPPSGFEA